MTLAVPLSPVEPQQRVAKLPTVSPAMLRAGRAAFMRERANLSDLYEFFDADRDQFIIAIYCRMAGAAP